MTTQAEFFQAHAIDGQLTDAQMAQLLELPEGDTSTLMLESGTPDPATVDTGKPAGEQVATTNETDIDPDKAIILAKDGKHTIPYTKLVEARDGEKHWKALAESAQAQLAELQAQAQQRSDAGQAQTATDKAVATAAAAIESGAVDPEIFGDFSEEALAKGIQKLVAMGVEQALAGVVKPLQEKQAVSAREAHYNAIYEAHADADSIVESKELDDWINKQPSFVRDGYRNVLKNGTAAEVIELFDSFKGAAPGGTQSPGASKPDVSAAAKAAIAKAKTPVPASLSDFPGGTAGPADELESMRQMQGADLLEAMLGKTPEQTEALMARLI
jgi:hypothetical protein